MNPNGPFLPSANWTGGSFVDISGVQSVCYGQLQLYKTGWYTFNNIQTYNSNVSTMRFAGSNLSYYQFVNHQEKNAFRQGQLLHIQTFPGSNWNSIMPG